MANEKDIVYVTKHGVRRILTDISESIAASVATFELDDGKVIKVPGQIINKYVDIEKQTVLIYVVTSQGEGTVKNLELIDIDENTLFQRPKDMEKLGTHGIISSFAINVEVTDKPYEMEADK